VNERLVDVGVHVRKHRIAVRACVRVDQLSVRALVTKGGTRELVGKRALPLDLLVEGARADAEPGHPRGQLSVPVKQSREPETVRHTARLMDMVRVRVRIEERYRSVAVLFM
jgi:predicted RNA-binding protein